MKIFRSLVIKHFHMSTFALNIMGGGIAEKIDTCAYSIQYLTFLYIFYRKMESRYSYLLKYLHTYIKI